MSEISPSTHDGPVLKKKRKIDQAKVCKCLVCGKKFLRGILDLNRHRNAVTLQHFWTETVSSSFPYPCDKCKLYFATVDNLHMHQNCVCYSKTSLIDDSEDVVGDEENTLDEENFAKKESSNISFTKSYDAAPDQLTRIENPEVVTVTVVENENTDILKSRRLRQGKAIIPHGMT